MQKLTSSKHLRSSSPTLSSQLSLGDDRPVVNDLQGPQRVLIRIPWDLSYFQEKPIWTQVLTFQLKGGPQKGGSWEVNRQPRVNKARKIELDSLCKSILHWQKAFVFQGQHSLSGTEQKKPLQKEISFLYLLLKKQAAQNCLYSKNADSRVMDSATLF